MFIMAETKLLAFCFFFILPHTFGTDGISYVMLMENAISKFQNMKNPDIQNVFKEEMKSTLELGNLGEALMKNEIQNDYFSETLGEDFEQCQNSSLLFREELMKGTEWALKMFDAYAKVPPAVMEGNTAWMGSYDECKRIHAVHNQTGEHLFNGQYCTLYIPFSPSNQMAKTFQGFAGMFLQYGLCLPDTCTNEAANRLINQGLFTIQMLLNRTVVPYVFVVCETPPEIDDAAVIAIIVLSFLVLLALLGTGYDLIFIQNQDNISHFLKKAKLDPVMKESNLDEKSPLIIDDKPNDKEVVGPGTLEKILLAFSLYTNSKKLLSTATSTDSLTAVNGIRFLSISWVVLGHTYASAISYSSNVGTFLPEVLDRWTFQAISNALVSVDSFFALSGLLLAYLTLKEMDKRRGRINWAMFYFHRFWRLTPPYMLVMLMGIGLVRYIGDGPNWPTAGFEQDQCKDTWWWNLLYINNFNYELDPNKTMCMGWSWYLANDMQFFILSPLMLIPLYYFEVVGVLVCIAFLLGTWIVTGVVSTQYTLPPTTFGIGVDVKHQEDYTNKYYLKPYCRMGPYVVGILTGYLLFKCKGKLNIHKFINLAAWAVATAAALSIVYGLHDSVNNNPLSTDISSLYNATHRTVWGACVCWVIFACATGNGGFINRLLSWSPFGPLARLSYCVYLAHLYVIMVNYSARRDKIQMENISMVFMFLGILLASNAIAFVTSLLFEAPMMGLEKVVFRRPENKGKSTT